MSAIVKSMMAWARGGRPSSSLPDGSLSDELPSDESLSDESLSLSLSEDSSTVSGIRGGGFLGLAEWKS